MMGLPSLTGTGRLTADPEIRFTQSGLPVCSVQIAFNARRFNKDTNTWEDGDVCYVRATAFKEMAENIAESLSKGDEVHVTGRLKTDQWEDRNTGEKRSGMSLLIDSIGPNLNRAKAKVTRASREKGFDSTAGQWAAAPAQGGGVGGDEPPF